jgi:hypothetical protein
MLDAFFHFKSSFEPSIKTPSYTTSTASATLLNLTFSSSGGSNESSFSIAFLPPVDVSFILYTLFSQVFQLKYNTETILSSLLF